MIWTEITSIDTIEDALAKPKNLFAIFKHSTRCSVSFMAMKSMNHDWPKEQTEVPLYLLDLIKYRDLSNQIASTFNVQHQSPQLIIIKDGEVVYHDSHSGIDGRAILKWIH